MKGKTWKDHAQHSLDAGIVRSRHTSVSTGLLFSTSFDIQKKHQNRNKYIANIRWVQID